MKIILARHGETEKNAAHRYLGHYDAELTETGREQLRVLTEKIDEPITTIYSSDLSRAMESAQIIGKRFQLTPLPVFGLRELHFGDWDCLTYEEILAVDQERLEKWLNDPYTIAPPNGETLLELGNRMDVWLHQCLPALKPDSTILIVSHGGPLRWFLSKWIKGDPKEFWTVEGVGHGKGIVAEWNEQSGKFTFVNKL